MIHVRQPLHRVIDACALAGALKRNILLTLAEAEFFRIRWSEPVLLETERAIAAISSGNGVADANDRAFRARAAMETAFEEAMVSGFTDLLLHGSLASRISWVWATACRTRAMLMCSPQP